MTGLRIDTTYFNHFKIKKLMKLLGAEGVVAHLALLCYVADAKPRGKLTGMTVEDIALSAGWDGDAMVFIRALVSLRLLDKRGKFYRVHDWKDHNQFIFHRPERIKRSRKAANIRWQKKSEEPTANIHFDVGANRIATGNATSMRDGMPITVTETETVKEEDGKSPNSNTDDISPEALSLYSQYLGTNKPPKPTGTEIDVLKKALREKTLAEWKPYLNAMNKRVRDSDSTRPSIKFFFDTDYSKFQPVETRQKVLHRCPQCKDDKGVTIYKNNYSECPECHTRRVPIDG